MKPLPTLTIAAAVALLYKSPGARAWFGSLLLVLGQEILDSLPDVDLDDEARERMRERIMTEIRMDDQTLARLMRINDERNGHGP